MNKVRLGVLILIIAIAASTVGFYIYKDVASRVSVPEQLAVKDENTAEANETLKNEEVKKEVPKPTIPAPDLSRRIVITALLPEETKKQAMVRIAEIIGYLKADKELFGDWIELGSYMKLIGDYDGAVIYWKYAAAIRPTSFLPLANLGDLYLFSIKDTAMAEKYYIASLKMGPDQVMVYEKLADLYKYFLKDDIKAKATLQDGINKNPSASDRLKYILNNYENN